MDSNLVSIIVPIYNGEKYIQRLVESVLSQTYNDIQLVLVDDGSTDHSLLLCERYAQNDSRILVLHQENKGVSVARNKGLQIAKGSYVIFVDVDDYIDSDYIMRLLKYADDDVIVVSDDEIDSDGFLLEGDEVISYLLNNWSVWGKLYSIQNITNIYFAEGVYIAEDLQFNVDLLLKRRVKKLYLIKGGYHYVNNDDSTMHTENYKKFMTGLMAEINCIERLKKYNYDLKESQIVLNGAYYALKFFWNQSFTSIINNYSDYKEIKRIIRENIREVIVRKVVDRKKFYMVILLTYFPWIGFFVLTFKKKYF